MSTLSSLIWVGSLEITTSHWQQPRWPLSAFAVVKLVHCRYHCCWWRITDVSPCILNIRCCTSVVCLYGLQDYYSMISDPLDLSKIMLKFHGGSYGNLQQFTKDMRDMFDNYKAYFVSSETEVWQNYMFFSRNSLYLVYVCCCYFGEYSLLFDVCVFCCFAVKSTSLCCQVAFLIVF